MSTFLLFALLGIGSGATYAILTLGLVLIYKGSGVLNFAQASVAMFSAYGYLTLKHAGLPTAPALIATMAAAAAGGVLFYLLVMRPLRTAPVLARVVATLGMFVALTGAAGVIWGDQDQIVSPIFPTSPVTVFGKHLGQDRLWLAGTAIVLAGVLWSLYRFTRFGLLTRAAAENEKGAALLGYSPETISAANWALGCMLSGVAGVLVAPLTGLDPTRLNFLIVPVFAAALVGRMSSFGVATAAGLLIGAGQSLITYYWIQPGVQDALPFLIVIATMALTGRAIPVRGTLSEGRPPLAPASRISPTLSVLFVGITVLLLVVFDRSYQSALATSMIIAVIALSLVVVTGYVGQISLAQMAFAGVGGFAVSKLGWDWGVPFPLTIVLAALVAVPIGAVIGLPALRVRGINLAIVTLGAAVAVSSMVFGNSDWTGGVTGSRVPVAKLGSYSLDSFAHPVRFGIFCLVVLAIAMVLVTNLRRGPSGRRMLAVRGNERAAAAAGINVAATKLHAFAFSAFIAALGGGVLAYQLENVAFSRFEPMQSVTLLIVAYIGGIAAVSGGLVAGIAASGGISFVFFSGLGAVGDWWNLISGAALILVVIGQPDGGAVVMRAQADWVKCKLKALRATPVAAASGP